VGPLSDVPAVLLEPIVRAALAEDLGRAGDITTDAVVPAEAHFSGAIVARRPGIVAGTAAAALAFRLLDAGIEIAFERRDGIPVGPGQIVARLRGPAKGVLAAERVALNFLCHLSGIATATRALVDAVAGLPTRIACTRKTVPGLRALAKHAVRSGGGVSHRFGLDDGILIKDNHIAVAGGVAEAIRRAKRAVGHMVKIEVEVDTLEQLAEAMGERVDAVLLDNMDPPTLRRAVHEVDRRAITEASGGVTLASVRAIAETGVDIVSAGWITHSAPALDLGLDEGV
jgi:nicotinate-nucleotide pyrophosphorylase (carboxylating)